MVSLSAIQSSNSLISSTLPPKLVAVFEPKAYFVGRSQDAGSRIAAECNVLNPAGEYIFVPADVSLIRVVDQVCKKIGEKEKAINILLLSAGVADIHRTETPEHLHLLVALSYYSRLRFILNFLPHLQNATSLRRVVYVGGGGYEGPLHPNDFEARHVPFIQIRGHLATMISLGLEAVAKTAPDVSFVHDFPGAVNTALFTHVKGILGLAMRMYFSLLGRWICVPINECGERHLYLATSSRYPPVCGECPTVRLGNGVEVAEGTTGEVGSGVYSILWDCDSSSLAVKKLLAKYRDKGMVEELWRHTESEFNRIT